MNNSTKRKGTVRNSMKQTRCRMWHKKNTTITKTTATTMWFTEMTRHSHAAAALLPNWHLLFISRYSSRHNACLYICSYVGCHLIHVAQIPTIRIGSVRSLCVWDEKQKKRDAVAAGIWVIHRLNMRFSLANYHILCLIPFTLHMTVRLEEKFKHKRHPCVHEMERNRRKSKGMNCLYGTC